MRNYLLTLILLFVPIHAHADPEVCDGALKVTLESEKVVEFCQVGNFFISKSCAENPKKCTLMSDLKIKLPKAQEKERLAPSNAIRNPGSKICQILGWKESMAEMWDESEICVCQHPKGGLVVCSSLI